MNEADKSIEADFLTRPGWLIVRPKDEDSGMTTHLGVLHPDEYVDTERLRRMIEPLLGFTYDEVRSVYKQGPKSAEQRALRSRIDARLLEVYEAGGNMVELGRALGLKVEASLNCRSIDNALARARKNGGNA